MDLLIKARVSTKLEAVTSIHDLFSCLAHALTRTQSFAIEGRRPRPKGQRDGKRGKRTIEMQLETLWTRVQPAVQGQDRFFDKGPACRAEASPDDRSYSPLLFAWSAAGRRLTRRSVSIWPEGHDHKVQRPSLSVWHTTKQKRPGGNKKDQGVAVLSTGRTARAGEDVSPVIFGI